MHRTVPVVVGLLALSGIAAAAAHYLGTPYNTGFLDYPTVTVLHVVLGGLYLTFAPFQFLPAVRNRWLGYHRWAGRSLVSIGLIVGFTGFFAATIFPVSGWPERIIVGGYAIFFFSALLVSAWHIRARRVAEHRAWMIRAFSIGLSIATMRIIFVPLLVLIGPEDVETIADLSIISFACAFFVHTVAAEWWLRRSQRLSVRPGFAGADS